MKSRLKDTLLLVGDASSDRANLYAVFEARYNLLEADNAAQGILLLAQNSAYIAAVLTDIPLTDDSGLRDLVDACQSSSENHIPVICLVTPIGNGQREETAFLLGATDVVQKPYTGISIQRRVDVLVDLYMHRWNLEKLVEDQSQAIRHNNQVMVDTLSSIIEHRSTESGNHVLRIRRFVKLLLQEISGCCPEYGLTEVVIDQISSAASLHDIGKITIPDVILNKPGQLTQEEFEVMKTHTTVGAQLVEQIGDIGDPLYLRYIYNIALYHHERWDGGGYPKGLAGTEIPLCAHVVGLVDAYDALTTARVYKEAYSHEKAVNMILNGECGAFAPRILECFKRVCQQFKELALLYADGYSPKSDDIRVPLPKVTPKAYELNMMQLSHLKYQTVLHHLNDTVVELDISNRNYHVIYNPDPDFVTLFADASFEEMTHQLMKDGAHPENAESIEQMHQQLREVLFRQNKRKVSFQCQIFSHIYGEYYPYEITLLRVNTGIPDQRIVIAIFHNLETTSAASNVVRRRELPESFALFGLSSGALCCCVDDRLTIDHGAGSLLPLTGFSSSDIRGQFGSSLLNLILEEDRSNLTNLLKTGRHLTENQECQCRILCKDRPPVWVLARFRMAIDSENRDVFYILFMDISSSKSREDALVQQARFHKTLTELSEGVLIEMDLRTRQLTCSERWQQRFGYPLRLSTHTPSPENMPHVHPDDYSLLHAALQQVMQGSRSAVADIRIANSEGRYLWSRVRCGAGFDADGKPERISAIIYDINTLKTDALSQKKKAEYDRLTKLLNKDSAQLAVTSYLEDCRPESLAALLILDLDNFKTVNDTLGHMYGDAVLQQVGNTLRNLFRPQDVVGRIGGDEFMILLKDIPGRDLVLDRCQLLIDTFRKLLHKLMPKLQVSISVGAALVPAHGTGYAELFRHADEALYCAKRAGKCQFHLYDNRDAYQNLSSMPLTLTRIDSGEQLPSDDASIIRFIFRRLYESRDIDATINELLAFIGTHFNVSRAYIFENNADNTACSNTFEWCNAGIEPQMDLLQNLSYETDLLGWPDVYKENGVLYCTNIRELEPKFQEILEPQGIKSMLHCAILDHGVFRGYVGFDECTANHLWTQGQVSLLQFMAEVLAVFLIKQRYEQQTKEK